MDKDSDPIYVREGRFRDGQNIRLVSEYGETGFTVETVQGNTYQFNLNNGSNVIGTSNKQWLFYLGGDLSLTTYYAYTVYDENGVLQQTFLSSFAGFSYTDWKNSIEAELNAFFGAGVLTINNNANNPYLYITKSGNLDWVITLYLSDSFTNSLEITQSAEARENTADLVGDLRIIGSKEVADVLFIFSTVCTSTNGGTGQIGVVQYDAVSNSYNYTQLITTKEFLFTTLHQIDCDGEHETTYHLYFEDDFNDGRCFYYKGTFAANGSMTNQGTVINVDGLYTYGSIANEMRLQALALNMRLVFASQAQGGGSLLAGNKRYTVRALTENLNASPFISLTNDIPVYSASTQGSAELLIGDLSGTPTGKANNLTVSGLDNDLFKYVELAVVEYYGTSQTVSIVSRTVITSGTMTLTHSGNETTTQLTFAELQEQIVAYKTAKSVRIVDRRLIRSNVTLEPDIQFDTSGIVQETKIKLLGSSGIFTGLRIGEYQDPSNVVDYAGYQFLETYKFAVKVTFNSGKYLVYPLSDWLCDPYNSNPDVSMKGFNLTETGSDSPDIRVAYNYLSNINMTVFGDTWEKFEIVRADLIPEVLLTGVMLRLFNKIENALGDIMSPLDSFYSTPNADSRYGGFIYSPDVLLGNTQFPTLRTSDVMYFFGNGNLVLTTQHSSPSTPTQISKLLEFDGHSSVANYNTYTNISATAIGFGGQASVSLNGTTWTFLNRYSGTENLFPYYADNMGQKGILISNPSPIFDSVSGNTDKGVYYVLIKRFLTDKYGDGTTISYGSTGHSQARITGQTVYTASVFGGDTFTQKTYIHNNYAYAYGQFNYGGAIGVYTQNKANSQLRYWLPAPASGYVFPGGMGAFQSSPLSTKFSAWILDNNSEQLNYDEAYSISNAAQLFPALDPNADPPTKFPARFPYSLQKPVGATKDFYRVFLPLNQYDEEISDGAVLHMENLNGNLYSWQPKGMKRQYVSATTTQQGSDGIDIVLGLANAFGTRGTKLTQYGTNHKWSVIKGRSFSGDDTAAWISTDYLKVLKFGGSGVEVVSDTKFMKTFFANNLQWVKPYDRPAHDMGINGVWDETNREFTFTVLAMRENTGAWNTSGYGIGDVATYSNYPIGLLLPAYVALNPIIADPGNLPPPSDPTNWELIPLTDTNYYNQYTIVYSEFKEGFTTFLAPKPLIYLPFKNTYFTPKPVVEPDFGQVYSNGGGIYLEWYNDGTDYNVLQDSASVTLVFNIEEHAFKAFYANVITALGKPDEMRYYTLDYETFTLAVDIEERNNQFVSPIRNDILTSSNGNIPTEETSRMKGKWLYCKWTAYTGSYKLLKDIIIDYRTISR